MSRWNTLRNLIDYYCPPNSVGVEIGVKQAVTTSHILKHSKNLRFLYAIDPWIDDDKMYFNAQKRIHSNPKLMILRMTSNAAARFVPNGLDFVFIDGDHSYEQVLADLNNWVPKLKSGGMLCGHDWCTSKRGVPQAGTKYIQENRQLFQQLHTDKQLIEFRAATDLKFIVGGRGLVVHKQRGTRYPVWWRIKA